MLERGRETDRRGKGGRRLNRGGEGGRGAMAGGGEAAGGRGRAIILGGGPMPLRDLCAALSRDISPSRGPVSAT